MPARQCRATSSQCRTPGDCDRRSQAAPAPSTNQATVQQGGRMLGRTVRLDRLQPLPTQIGNPRRLFNRAGTTSLHPSLGLPHPPQAREQSALQPWQLQHKRNAPAGWPAGGSPPLPPLPPPPGPSHPAACRRGVLAAAAQWLRPPPASTSPCWWPPSGLQGWRRWRRRSRCAGAC